MERFFNRIKQCRRVAIRYDKLAANYLAFIKLAAIRIWLRAYGSTPYIRCAVQVPEHNAARQVPDPEVPERRPEPTARFMPLASVT